MSEVKSEITVLRDPANVLMQIEDIEKGYRRITQQVPIGKMLEDAEEIVGPIDVPPYVDSRLRTAIEEIKSLILVTLSAQNRQPTS